MIEVRHHSLYQRLHTAGLLDEVMRDLIDGVKNPRDMARYLKTKGIDIGERAVYNFLRTHGTRWRYEQAESSAHDLGLPEDMDAAAAEMLRRKIALCMFEADGLKELSVLARISGDSEKLRQAERKVRVAEKTLEARVDKERTTGAEWIMEVLSDMALLNALRTQDEEARQSGAGVAERIKLIKRRVWGDVVEGGQP